jgi:hypothetical protein
MTECICFVMQADLVEHVVAHAVQQWFQWCFTHWWNQTHFRASLNQATGVGVTSMLSPGCFADFWQSASKVLCLEGYVQGAGGCNHCLLGRCLYALGLDDCLTSDKLLCNNGYFHSRIKLLQNEWGLNKNISHVSWVLADIRMGSSGCFRKCDRN